MPVIVDLTKDYGTCVICHEDLLPTMAKFHAHIRPNECTHYCHERCLLAYIGYEMVRGREPRCPVCRVGIDHKEVKMRFFRG